LQQGTLSPYCNSPLGNAGLSATHDFCKSAFCATHHLAEPLKIAAAGKMNFATKTRSHRLSWLAIRASV
jgi:hypothetical protein